MGDIIHPPGATYSGRIARIDLRRKFHGARMPGRAAGRRLTTTWVGCGLVWMDESYIKPRPKGEVDHGKASGC
jgi:hypothetical protein